MQQNLSVPLNNTFNLSKTLKYVVSKRAAWTGWSKPAVCLIIADRVISKAQLVRSGLISKTNFKLPRKIVSGWESYIHLYSHKHDFL
ncbi:hypothetical protein GCM10028826_05270 [Mucilaginibacter boryungensis]